MKNHFAKVIKEIEKGEKIAVTFGRTKRKVAVIIPFEKYFEKKETRKLGILAGKAKITFSRDFKITDEELFTL